MVVCLLLAGCTSLGPRKIVRDRFDYTTAIASSWKSQMLLNIVKTRYGDAPVFLDVVSVISQYSLAEELDLGVDAQLNRQETLNFYKPGGLIKGIYIDRPTITYTPLTGKKFAQSLMTAIPPISIWNLIQSGYPVDIVFRLCVQSINGLRNRTGRMFQAHAADPEFYALIGKMQKVQSSGGIGLRIVKDAGKENLIMVFRSKTNDAIEAESAEIRRMLGLDPSAQEFKVVYGAVAASGKEIAIQSRSLLDIIIELSSTIDVPPEHVAERRVSATMKEDHAQGAFASPLIRVHSSRRKPADVFAAVPYDDYWFWIDDKDYSSKRLFSSLMLLFTLTETDEKEGAPIVTIPAN